MTGAKKKGTLSAIDGGKAKGESWGYPLAGDDWEQLLLWKHRPDGGKTLQSSLANVAAILRHAPSWAGCVGFNEAHGEIEFTAPPPFVDHEGPWRPREISDADEAMAAIWLEREWHLRAPTRTLHEALVAVATARSFNPITTYLSGLRWDGVRRLDTWLVTYCQAKDTAYVRGIGAAWMRQAVARAFEPGCPFYAALIFEGYQGRGKSSAFAILAGEHFLDDVVDLHSRDAAAQIRRAWIVEMAELSALRRSELEQTKAFLTRRTDRQRLAFRRNVTEMARRCVFAGSTNTTEYLHDATGNRRFWPVWVEAINLDALARDRDQLWAEAVASWRKGAGTNLPPELWEDAAEEQAERVESDPWEERTREHLKGLRETTITAALVSGTGIGLKLEQVTERESKRMGRILRACGWWPRQVRDSEDKGKRRTVFEPRSLSLVSCVSSPKSDPSEGVTEAEKTPLSVVSGVQSEFEAGAQNVGGAVNENSPVSQTTTDTTDTTDNSQNKASRAVTRSFGEERRRSDTSDKGAWERIYQEALASGQTEAGARAIADFEVGDG